MFGRRTRLTTEQAAEVLDNLHGPATRSGHRLRVAALALTPDASTSQSEPHRRRVKDVMLREFSRGPNLAVRNNDDEGNLELPGYAPSMMVVNDQAVQMADLDAIDPDKAARAVNRVAALAAARAERHR